MPLLIPLLQDYIHILIHGNFIANKNYNTEEVCSTEKSGPSIVRQCTVAALFIRLDVQPEENLSAATVRATHNLPLCISL